MMDETARSSKELRANSLRCRVSGDFLHADDIRPQAIETGDQQRITMIESLADVPEVQAEDLDAGHEAIRIILVA